MINMVGRRWHGVIEMMRMAMMGMMIWAFCVRYIFCCFLPHRNIWRSYLYKLLANTSNIAAAAPIAAPLVPFEDSQKHKEYNKHEKQKDAHYCNTADARDEYHYIHCMPLFWTFRTSASHTLSLYE